MVDCLAAALRIQRAARAHRVRRAARILSRLPLDLRALTVNLAQAKTEALVARDVVVRLACSGISLGRALADALSWEAARLDDHFIELQQVFLLSITYLKALKQCQAPAVQDLLKTVVFYEHRQRTMSCAWMRCHTSMRVFVRLAGPASSTCCLGSASCSANVLQAHVQTFGPDHVMNGIRQALNESVHGSASKRARES